MTSVDYDPFVTGPHPVGSRTWQARDEARDRLFTCEIWYPAEPDQLRSADDNGELRDAAPRPGVHPLVVFSRFSGGGRRVSSFLCRHLTSHGYAVAALDHSEVAAPELAARPGETPEQRAARVDAVMASRVPDVCFLLAHLASPGCALSPRSRPAAAPTRSRASFRCASSLPGAATFPRYMWLPTVMWGSRLTADHQHFLHSGRFAAAAA
jgi:predicted dienelactone hydrolase